MKSILSVVVVLVALASIACSGSPVNPSVNTSVDGPLSTVTRPISNIVWGYDDEGNKRTYDPLKACWCGAIVWDAGQ